MAMTRRSRMLGSVLFLAIAATVFLFLTKPDGGEPRRIREQIRPEQPPAALPATRQAEPGPAPVIQPLPSPPQEGADAAASSRATPQTGIRGRVATTAGVAVSGARVSVEYRIDYARDRISRGEGFMKVFPPAATTVTDAAGSWEIVPLQPRSCTVFCEADGFGGERIESVDVVKDRVTQVDFTLSPGRELPGEVVDASGSPVPGAEIFVETWFLRRLVADDRGRFTVTLPRRTTSFSVTLRAAKEGVGVGSETLSLGDDLPAFARIALFRARRLTLRFQPDDGSPPPANLRFSVATYVLPRYFVFVGATDPSGVGTVATLPEVDQISVMTDDPAWCLPWPGGRSNAHVMSGADRTLTPVGDVSIDVPVTRTGTLSGTVVDRTSGKPVPGLPIQATARGSQPIPAGLHYQRNAVTDDTGAFRFDGLQRAETGITVRSTRWLIWPDGWDGEPIPLRGGFERSTFFGQYPLNQSASVDGVVVKVVEAGTVEGVVVDSSGAPVAAAEVDTGFETLDPRTQFSIDGRHWREDFGARADSTGRFVLAGVQPSPKCRIRARRPNTPWTWSEPFDLAPGATKRDLRVALPAGKSLIVSVVSPDGAAVAGAEILIQEGEHSAGEPAGPPRSPLLRQRTGKDGLATFASLVAETVGIGANEDTLPDGLRPAEGTPRSAALPEAGVNRFTIQLQPAIFLTGKVVLEDGKTPGFGSITAIAVGERPTGESTESGKVAADGSFTIRVRSSRPHTIREFMATRYVPRGPGVSVDQRLEKFVPAKAQELRPGEPAVVTVRRG
jgi:protocatechuate 3,4-dioxygenase beta subunit